MSTEAVKWAMDDAPMLRTDKGKPDTTARHVLQALAEHAHKDGSNARPSVLRIQYRTGYDRRTIQRALRRLEDAKLIEAKGVVNGCTSYTLDLTLRRPASDWEALEAEEEQMRRATAERVRRHRAKRVTHAESVTETHSGDVTEPDVTHSDDVRNASEVRYVTHSDDVRNALSAARTIKEPTEEPPGKTTSTRATHHNPAPRPPAPMGEDDDRRPGWLIQLQEAMSAAGINVPWKFHGDDMLRLHNDIKRLGIPLMIEQAVKAEQAANKPPFSSRWFYDNWHAIPTPVAIGDGSTGGNVVALRSAPVSRQQQETDDMFDRAMARAKARMQQESS